MKKTERPYHHGHLRAALLEVAEKALESGGMLNISLRDLSRQLGVSHTSPRRHFADKQALLDALAISGYERFDAALTRALKAPARNFQTRLVRLGRAFIGFALKHPALFSLMAEAKYRPDPPPPRELLQAAEKAYGRGPAAFAEAQAAGEIIPGDPARHALVLFAALQGLLVISTHGKFKGISLDTLTVEVVDRIITGLRPR